MRKKERNEMNNIVEKLEFICKKIIHMKSLIVYFLLLFIYDFVCFGRGMRELLTQFLLIVCTLIPIYFSLLFVVRFCIRNSEVPTKDLCLMMKGAMGVSLFCSVALFVHYLIYGFTVSTFLCPTICLITLKVLDIEKGK